jgi:hypothetical protein
MSPLYRAFDSAKPFLLDNFGEEKTNEMENNYKKIKEKYEELFNSKTLLEHTLSDNQQLFEI